MENFVIAASNNFVVEEDEKQSPLKTIFKQYESVIIESIITSFGLDFIIKDQYGGDVDTINNVRKVGQSSPDGKDVMTYKNKQNEQNYNNRGDYNSSEYHSSSAYKNKNKEISAQRKSGKLVDSYTGKKIKQNDKSDLDHVISAKEIHDDRGRVLAGLDGVDLANSDENLKATNPHTNRTKKADTMDDFLDKHGDEYTDKQKENMKDIDKQARAAYEKKLAKTYYTSPQFANDTALAAGKVGVKMGLREAFGFMFANIWFEIKAEFEKANLKENFEFGAFFNTLGNAVKQGIDKSMSIKSIGKLLQGTVAGALSSFTTTICNIFFTTAKNVVKIIRQSYASIVQALKVLFINPDHYTFSEKLVAVSKIIATGASVVLGTIVTEAINSTPIGAIPVLGDVISAFCGSMVTGILSCTLLYLIDHRGEIVNKLMSFFKNINFASDIVNNYQKTAEYFENYAALLMEIDIQKFKEETELFNSVTSNIGSYRNEEELNRNLRNIYDKIGIDIPWKGYDSFDSFMKDDNAVLVFE